MKRFGPVAFRFDAGVELGGGHAMRCLGLADALEESGIESVFAVQASSLRTLPALACQSARVVMLDGESRFDNCSILKKKTPEWLIVDHPDWDASRMRSARAVAPSIAAISDAPGVPLDCDLLLDTSVGRVAQEYVGLIPEESTVITGPEYALLRPSFAVGRQRSIADRKHRKSASRAMVAFGATDPNGATMIALDALERAAPNLLVDIVLGSSTPCLGEVRKRVAARPAELRLHLDTDRMAVLLAASDFVIGAAGITTWERCCLGIPSIVITQAENQLSNAAALAFHGAADVLGSHDGVTPEDLARAVSEITENSGRRLEMSTRAATLCDGLGARRVAMNLYPEGASDGKPVSLRPPRLLDSDLLRYWQSDPTTRRYSRNPAVPSPEEHDVWFKESLLDPAKYLNIILYNGEAAGMLRLDLRPVSDVAEAKEAYEISILSAPEFRRKGVASAALRLARRLLPNADLFAYVMTGNEASQSLFRAEGYQLDGDYFVQESVQPSSYSREDDQVRDRN